MRKMFASIVAAVVLTVFASSPLAATEITASITVSPNVINIASASTVVTVHTDIAYWTVVTSSVYLNEDLIDSWKADDRGNFVAKFSSDEIKNLAGVKEAVANGTDVALTLKGLTTGGDEFTGTDYVKVIDVKAKK